MVALARKNHELAVNDVARLSRNPVARIADLRLPICDFGVPALAIENPRRKTTPVALTA